MRGKRTYSYLGPLWHRIVNVPTWYPPLWRDRRESNPLGSPRQGDGYAKCLRSHLFFISCFLFHSLDLVQVLRGPTRRIPHFIGLAHRTTSTLGLVHFHVDQPLYRERSVLGASSRNTFPSLRMRRTACLFFHRLIFRLGRHRSICSGIFIDTTSRGSRLWN